MNNEFDYFDLALRFIHDQVTAAEKREVHQLILTEPDFLETLKEQLALQREFELLKQSIPDSLKQSIYLNITSQKKEIGIKVLEVIFEHTLPTIIWRGLKIFQRRVFVYE